MERVGRTLSFAGFWRRKTGGGTGWGICKQVGFECRFGECKDHWGQKQIREGGFLPNC